MPVVGSRTGTGAPAVAGVAGEVTVPKMLEGEAATPFNVSLV